MHIKHYDEKGNLCISFYSEEDMQIYVKELQGNSEKFCVMMSNITLASNIGLEEAENIIHSIFDALDVAIIFDLTTEHNN